MAASSVVSADPLAASHISGAAESRKATAGRSAIAARMNAIAATNASQSKARRPGGGNRRTGLRSAVRLWMMPSCRNCACEVGGIMASPYRTEASAQTLQGAMQIHLERSLAAPGRCRRLRQRAFLQDQQLDRLALSQRQIRDGLSKPCLGAVSGSPARSRF